MFVLKHAFSREPMKTCSLLTGIYYKSITCINKRNEESGSGAGGQRVKPPPSGRGFIKDRSDEIHRAFFYGQQVKSDISCPQQAMAQGSQPHALSTVTTIPQASQTYFAPFFAFETFFTPVFLPFLII
jgi:hypothetical protein